MKIDLLREKRTYLEKLGKNGPDNGKQMYQMICNVTAAVLEDHYEKSVSEISFPVDIRGIVKRYEIEIIETDLNTDIGFQAARQNGSLRYLPEDRVQIYLEASDSENAKRYILAHEFCYFLMNTAGDTQNVGCGNPMMPKEWEELTADMMAACLLFPPELVMKKMRSFIDQMGEEKRYPISPVKWLEELSESAQVSLYYTTISYQYIRSFICYLYNADDSVATAGQFAGLFK